MVVALTPHLLREEGIGNFFRAEQVQQLGVSPKRLGTMVRNGTVERVSRGLYRLSETEPTEHYSHAAVCAQFPNSVLCLLTALMVHHIGTELPRHVWVGIPNKAKPPRSAVVGIRSVYFRSSALTCGVDEHRFEGVPVRVTTPARTIVDLWRFERLVGRECVLTALEEAMWDGKATVKELNRIMKMLPSRRLRDHLAQLA